MADFPSESKPAPQPVNPTPPVSPSEELGKPGRPAAHTIDPEGNRTPWTPPAPPADAPPGAVSKVGNMWVDAVGQDVETVERKKAEAAPEPAPQPAPQPPPQPVAPPEPPHA